MNKYAFGWAMGLSGLMVFSQSCALVGRNEFSATVARSPLSYSMTGSEKIYDYGKGKAAFYTQELEDIYSDGVIDLLNSPDPKVRHVIEKIPFSSQFYILILNGDRSPKSLLQINESYQLTGEYGKQHQRFTLNPNVHTSTQLKSLKFHFVKNAVGFDEIAEANINCVISNLPGPHGEYRSGALTLQIVDAMAGRTLKLLAEFTIHQEAHRSSCQ